MAGRFKFRMKRVLLLGSFWYRISKKRPSGKPFWEPTKCHTAERFTRFDQKLFDSSISGAANLKWPILKFKFFFWLNEAALAGHRLVQKINDIPLGTIHLVWH